MCVFGLLFGVSSFASHLPNASEERQLPPLGINALARLVKILFVQLEADEVPLFLDAGDRRCAAAHAIIQNRVAFVAVGADEVSQQTHGLLGWVKLLIDIVLAVYVYD